MCKAPKPPAPKDPEKDKPEWLRNPYLDAAFGQAAAVNQLRQGRSSLRIGLGSKSTRQPGTTLDQPQSNTPAPSHDARKPFGGIRKYRRPGMYDIR